MSSEESVCCFSHCGCIEPRIVLEPPALDLNTLFDIRRTFQCSSKDCLFHKEEEHQTTPTTCCNSTRLEDPSSSYNSGAWTEKEKRDFERGYKECGKQWKKIAECYVLTRDRKQVSSYGQKYLARQLKSSNKIRKNTCKSVYKVCAGS